MNLDRNRCMDTIKGFACIMVVLIHYNWGDTVSICLKTIGRFAVPYFYFLAGYYIPNHEGRIVALSMEKKLKRSVSLLWKSALFYTVFCVYWNSIMDSTWNLWTFTREKVTVQWVIKLFLSCDPAVYAHFWYLIASILCYLVIYALYRKLENHRVVYPVAFAVLLCVYSLFAEFNNLVGWNNFLSFTEDSRLVVSNTFILRAMPFFLFGIALKKYAVADCRKVNFGILLLLVFAGSALAIVEDRQFGTTLMYVGTHVTVIALSLISIWYPQKKLTVMEYIGSKLSMYVYIYHIAVGKVLDLIASKQHLWGNVHFKALRPVLVLIGSLLVAQLLTMIAQGRKRRLKAEATCNKE